MPIYPYSFQLPPLNVQDIPNDGAPGEFLGINVGGALDWLPAGGGGSGDMLAANNLSELTNFATARTNIGLGTASTPTFANLTLTSPSLASSAPVTISQTWNNAAVAFTGLKFNAAGTSDANSASGSLLADFQLGGVSKAWVTKQGGYRASIGQFVNGNGIGFAGGLNTGFYSVAGEQIFLAANNSVPIEFKSTSIVVNSAATFGFGQVGVGADTILVRDSASGNTLALRNGALPQTFNVYGTSSSNNTVYERMFMRYTAASTLAFQIGTEQVGATARPLEFLTAGVKRMALSATGSPVATLFAPSNTVSNILVLRNLSDAAKFQFYLNASGNSEFYIGASNVLLSEVGNSYFNGGNVGIGTTAPKAKLHVIGGDSATTFTAATIALGFGTGSLPYPHFIHTRHAGVAAGNCIDFYTCDGDGNGVFPTNAVHGLTIENGKVGIGTTSPTSKLHVYLNPANNYTTETVNFGNIHFANGTGGYSNLWMGSISTPLTLSASNYTLANDGTYTIINGGSGGLYFHVGAVAHWNIQSTGHLQCASDNSRDIGAVNSQRPRNIYVGSDVISRPSASITPANNGQLVVEATSNTTLTFKLKGTDGTVRTGTITLA